MIDVHCHLLPGIDDGSHDLHMSLAMARVAAESGTRQLVCTPHHLNGVYHNERASVLELVDDLRAQLEQENVPLRLHPGSELHLVPELASEIAAGRALTYADKGCHALVELPKRTIPLGVENVFSQLAAMGIVPVIAHPERNADLARKPETASAWVASGVCLQLTAQSCTGEFGEPIRQACLYWLARGEAHLVASDAHRPTGRAPRLDRACSALTELLGEEAAAALLEGNPGRLLAGQTLVSPGRQPQLLSQPATIRSRLGSLFRK